MTVPDEPSASIPSLPTLTSAIVDQKIRHLQDLINAQLSIRDREILNLRERITALETAHHRHSPFPAPGVPWTQE